MSVHIENSSSQIVTVNDDGTLPEGTFSRLVEHVLRKAEGWAQEEQRRFDEMFPREGRREDGEPSWRASMRVEFTVDDAF